jgi:leucyl/phenylalanyl-tRNA--protein transferase
MSTDRGPVEPPPSRWRFPPIEEANEHGVVGIGADLEPGTILAAYRQGIFPMPARPGGPIAWWCPDPRAVLPLDGLRVSRSLRRSVRRFEVRWNTAFEDVIVACADPARPHGWIDEQVVAAYVRLHRMGWAHSVEVCAPDGRLVGGLYGIAVAGLFAGESMFHLETDASKVALVALVEQMRSAGAVLLDVQWQTPHLESLGAVEIPRAAYLERVAEALDQPPWAPPAAAVLRRGLTPS